MAIMQNLKSIGSKVSKTWDAPYELTKKGVKKTLKHEKYGPIINAKEINGETQRMENFYTGKKMSPLWVGGAGLAFLAGSNAKNSFEHNVTMQIGLATKNAEHYGKPDVLMYDGVSQERAPKNLNAEGSLVMGLHNMRKG